MFVFCFSEFKTHLQSPSSSAVDSIKAGYHFVEFRDWNTQHRSQLWGWKQCMKTCVEVWHQVGGQCTTHASEVVVFLVGECTFVNPDTRTRLASTQTVQTSVKEHSGDTWWMLIYCNKWIKFYSPICTNSIILDETFTGLMTQPTVSKHWRRVVSHPDRPQSNQAHLTVLQ